MICESAAKVLPGLDHAKIRAHEVSNGDGNFCEWRPLDKTEHVLGWMVSVVHGSNVRLGIYGVVDSDFWPIVIGHTGRSRKPVLLKIVGEN